MQESAMLKINIDSDSKVTDWAVVGGPDDCLEGFSRLAELGVEYVNMTFLNLPKTLEGRKEFLQSFAEKGGQGLCRGFQDLSHTMSPYGVRTTLPFTRRSRRSSNALA